jgi:hypothetical protein
MNDKPEIVWYYANDKNETLSIDEVRQKRRELVSSFAVKGLSQREITEEVGKKIVNPETGKPFSLSVIHHDIQALKREWRERAFTEFSEHVAVTLAKLDQLERESWDGKEYEMVLKVIDRKIKLLGLNAPDIVLNIDWRMQVKALLQRKLITIEDVKNELGETIAKEFDESSRLPSGKDGADSNIIEGTFSDAR